MSQLSCISALKQILSAEVAGIKVIDIMESMPTLPADQAPYIIIDTSPIREIRLSGGRGGGKRVAFDVDLHLFVFYGAVDEFSAEDFRGFVDHIQAVIRNSWRLNNLADTPNSQLLFVGENIRTSMSPWTEDSSGTFLYHAIVSTEIVELAHDIVG